MRKIKASAALLAATVASSFLLMPGTASAASFPVQFDVRSVPAGSSSIWVNNSGRCIRVSGAGSYSSGATVNEGAYISFSWQQGSSCSFMLNGYRPVDIQVRNPAPNKNFWITVTSSSGRR